VIIMTLLEIRFSLHFITNLYARHRRQMRGCLGDVTGVNVSSGSERESL
jgi:hypothetical protein